MRILVISLAGVGDTLCATPLIHELRERYPFDNIDVLVRWEASADLLRYNPHIDRIRTLEDVPGLRNKCDITINTHPQGKTLYRLIARYINADTRISHKYHWWDRLLVNKLVSQNYDTHVVQNNFNLIDLKANRYSPEIHFSKADLDWASETIASQFIPERPVLGIHAGSGGTKNLALRRWPMDNYIKLTKQLGHQFNIIWFGSGDEIPWCQPRTDNIRQAAALMRYCDIFLSVDTVFMHLAAAMKVRKQIVIETPTLNKTVLPYGNDYTLVPNPLVRGDSLQYYRYDGKGIRGSEKEIRAMMESVTVHSVYRAICQP